MNAEESDGTVIFYDCYLEGGTEQTVTFCMKLKKPYKLIDSDLTSIEQATEKVIEFVRQYEIGVLNVAGPRASKTPSIYAFVTGVINSVVPQV